MVISEGINQKLDRTFIHKFKRRVFIPTANDLPAGDSCDTTKRLEKVNDSTSRPYFVGGQARHFPANVIFLSCHTGTKRVYNETDSLRKHSKRLAEPF